MRRMLLMLTAAVIMVVAMLLSVVPALAQQEPSGETENNQTTDAKPAESPTGLLELGILSIKILDVP